MPRCLTLFGGGLASDTLWEIARARAAAQALTSRLGWLGAPRATRPRRLLCVGRSDPWARGGYAVFSPSFDPALRHLLARGDGPHVFAGDHIPAANSRAT